MGRVFAYLRVSRDGQDTENQKMEVIRYCRRCEIDVDEIVVDHAVSGKVKVSHRKLGEMIDNMVDGDTLIVTEISRIGRDWFDILNTVNNCFNKGINLIIIKQGYELKNNAMGKMFVSIMSLFAEEERRMISERTKMALARKKSEGMILGRPVGYGKLDGADEYLKVMISHKIKRQTIANFVGVSRMRLNSYMRERGIS